MDAKRRMIIEGFGAIKKMEIALDNELNIIIGPQASGKSTIGKIIYFCSKIRDYYVDYILQEAFFCIYTRTNCI